MTTSNTEPNSATESGAADSSPAPGPVPTGHDVPLSVSVLVFLRDRGIFMLWGLLIVVFAVWCSPFFLTVDNALLVLSLIHI